MIKLEFENAVVEDHGLGVRVNGRALDTIISTALGTAVPSERGLRVGDTSFRCNACDITLIIEPKRVVERIEDGNSIFNSVVELEEYRYEQFKEEFKKTNTEI